MALNLIPYISRGIVGFLAGKPPRTCVIQINIKRLTLLFATADRNNRYLGNPLFASSFHFTPRQWQLMAMQRHHQSQNHLSFLCQIPPILSGEFGWKKRYKTIWDKSNTIKHCKSWDMHHLNWCRILPRWYTTGFVFHLLYNLNTQQITAHPGKGEILRVNQHGYRKSRTIQRATFPMELNTLPPIIMEVENGYIWKVTILLEGPIFDFHDYGRKCNTLRFSTQNFIFAAPKSSFSRFHTHRSFLGSWGKRLEKLENGQSFNQIDICVEIFWIYFQNI